MTPSHRYRLDVAINSVSCEIVVNDIPVLRSYSGDRLDVVMPVGEAIVPGTNMLMIRTLVDRSQGGASATLAKVTLMATPYAASDWRPIMTVQTRAAPGAPGEAGTEGEDSPLGRVSPQASVYDGEIQLLESWRTIELRAEVPGWAWLGAPVIPDTEAVRADLVIWYRGLLGMMAEHRTDAVAALIQEKVAEIALAYGLSQPAAAAEIGLAWATDNRELAQGPVAWDELALELAGAGRLARLYHPDQGTVVSLVNGIDLHHNFEMWLRRGPAGWIVSR